jgi:feruloyl-CoA synthase
VGDWLERWAASAPERTFLAERGEPETGQGRGWRRVAYGEALGAVRSIARGLLDLGAAPDRPVVLLSDNGVDHALVQLAAMHAGIPAAPVSPAYSLASRDFAKLREILDTVGPGVLFADDAALFAGAIAAASPGARVPLVSSRGPGAARIRELRSCAPLERVATEVGPDTIAKILFTSGSTGSPKGVVNTQRMLCSNQQAIAQVWPLLAERPPVVVDWLPWSHTFGGNHNFNMVLASGGTLFIDAGKPAPGRFDETVANLREVSPTLYFNVPRGFERLAGALEEDAALGERFFADLDLLFYAAAALPQSTWERLERLAARHRPGKSVPFVSAWGSTETAPLVTSVHFPIDRAGVIGLPAPGCELKLVPVSRDGAGEAKLEMRVRGPNVTPGYWERGGRVRPIALDDDGFLSTGDAGRLEDPAVPARGVVFDGRTAENFKLSSGTWVMVGELRVRAITACAPLVQDAVVAGHDRDSVALLLFLAPSSLPPPELRARLAASLRAHNAANPGTSSRIARALVLEEPASIDAGEITDKGYINQRAVLDRRSALVEQLYADVPNDAVLVIDAL